MRLDAVRTRLPLALLGALVVLLAGSPPARASIDLAAAASHATVAGGHAVDGALTTAHPRASSPLPAGLPAAGLAASGGSVQVATESPRPRSHRRIAIPPTAIRGPPG